MAYNDSELIVTTNELQNLPAAGQKKLDYVNDWVDLTVENEIWRGKKLREEKPLPDKAQRECDVINIDFLASFCNGNQRRVRKTYLTSNIDKTSPSIPRNACPCAKPNSASSANLHRSSRTNTSRSQTKKLRKCSMRIAELAVPTKRQCIDTWRDKSYILPEFMVQRLKQHVMDQRPIVQIPEALYCFQRKPRPKSSKTAFQNKKEINYQCLKLCSHMDTRTLCIIFGHKIAKILSNPLNLTLNTELQNLSNVVAADIRQMISKSRRIPRQIKPKHGQKESIHKDVSNKIAVWIASILQDLSLKMLEEDLKVRKENEEIISKFSERFVTIMETILLEEQRTQPTDLEEEEGPVLDFIDDLVENVMNICEPLPAIIDEESDTFDSSRNFIAGEDSVKPLTPEESLGNQIMTVNDSEKPLTPEESLGNQIMTVNDSEKPLMPEESLGIQIMTVNPNSNIDSANSSTDLEENQEFTDAQHFRNEIWDLIQDKQKISNNLGNELDKINKEVKPTSAESGKYDINGENTDKMDNDTTNVTQNIENFDKIDDDTANVIQNDEINYGTKNLIKNGETDDGTTNVMQNNETDSDATTLTQNNKIDNDTTNAIQNDEIDNNKTNVIQKEIDYDTANVMQNSENDIDIHTANVMQIIKNEIYIHTTNVMQNDEIDSDITNVIQTNQLDNNTTNGNAIDSAENTDSNVSEVFQIFAEDSDDEKNSQKVTFSVTDLVNPHQFAEDTKSRTDPENDKPEQIQWNNNKNVKSNVFFAEPNEHLLSNADESWPFDLLERPKLIVSETVTKSVTSLGNILENDEKLEMDSEMNIFEQQKRGNTAAQEKVNKDAITHPTEKYDIASQTYQVSKEEFIESTTATSEIDNNIKQSSIIPQTFENELVEVDTSFKQEKHQTVLGECNLVEIDNTANQVGTQGDIIPNHKTQSQVDYGWKVHPKTAPSWVTAWGLGHGEPSEDSIPVHKTPTKLNESDVLKWCKDLEKAFVNLEMWKNWIENTCKETVFLLKQKELACVSLKRKNATNWIRLTRNIHKDAILWTKLHLRTKDNFKIMKRKYNSIEYSSNKAPTSDVNKEIIQTMREFENLSVMLHEMIVTAEYCAMCTCNKTNTGKNMNMEKYLCNITE